jgi:hypothetical protein
MFYQSRCNNLVPLWNVGIQNLRNRKNVGLELATNYNCTGIYNARNFQTVC